MSSRFSSGSITIGGAATGDMSATLTSDALAVDFANSYSIQAVFLDAVAPDGTFKLEASIDGVNWSEITDTASTITAAGTVLWDVSDVGHNKVRVVYTFAAAGTGTLSLLYSYKGS